MIIYLTGFMGSGKTVVGRELQHLLSWPLLDMDEEIERTEGCPVSEIFATRGEDAFRDAETALLKELSGRDLLLVSCGGGVVLRQENRKIMKESGSVVYLSASPETVYERLQKDSSRPLLQNKKSVEDIRTMMEGRRPFYEEAGIVIDVETKTPKEVAEEIKSRCFSD